MDSRADYLELDIEQYLLRNFGVKVSDCVQVLKKYLYIEFYHRGRQTKLRLYYPVDREDFMGWSAGNRFNWIEHQILKQVLRDY